MGIKQEVEGVKTLFGEGLNLLMLRLRILCLDIGSQASGLIKIAVIIAVSAILCLVGLVAALFGLYAVLPQEAKIWVFFGIAAGSFLIALCLLLLIAGIWRKGGVRIMQTLEDMQEDLAYLADKKRPSAAQPDKKGGKSV